MGINGSKGRARALRAIRREREALARQHGIDPADRRAFAAFEWDWSRVTMLGIRDRARCRCGGDNHDIITKTKGI